MKPYKNKQELVNECVGVHLALADSALAQARGQATGFDGIDAQTATQQARLAWSAMQRARLFCFDPERWIGMHKAADRYVHELAKVEWLPGRRDVPTEADEILGSAPNSGGGKLWGILDEEAVKRGYIECVNGKFSITQEGWIAFRQSVDRMPRDKHLGYQEALAVHAQATQRGNRAVSSIALAQILDALQGARETPEYQEGLVSAFEDYGVRWPFPEPLPFDACFFCFGRRLNLVYAPSVLHARIQPANMPAVSSVYLLGYLVAWEGDVPFVFTALQFGDGNGLGGFDPVTGDVHEGGAVGLVRTYDDGEWQQPRSLDPWILSMLTKAVHDHKRVIEDHAPTFGSRTLRKLASKGHKELLPLPAPFYMVNLKDELIEPPRRAPKKSSGRPVEWSHRWDVRGHECIRIERGTLPIPDKEVLRLRKRDYRVYEGMTMDAEDAARLLKRGIRVPGPQEWIAVLSYNRDSFVKGPVGKPYVPAARVEPRVSRAGAGA